jgi:hypothetical protein
VALVGQISLEICPHWKFVEFPIQKRGTGAGANFRIKEHMFYKYIIYNMIL